MELINRHVPKRGVFILCIYLAVITMLILYVITIFQWPNTMMDKNFLSMVSFSLTFGFILYSYFFSIFSLALPPIQKEVGLTYIFVTIIFCSFVLAVVGYNFFTPYYPSKSVDEISAVPYFYGLGVLSIVIPGIMNLLFRASLREETFV